METTESTLELDPIKQQPDALCDVIVGQESFKDLHRRIEAFMEDEKLKYDYGSQ